MRLSSINILFVFKDSAWVKIIEFSTIAPSSTVTSREIIEFLTVPSIFVPLATNEFVTLAFGPYKTGCEL